MAAVAPLMRPSVSMSASTPTLSTMSNSASIKRRSTLKRSIDDTSFRSAPSSPSKRTRVTFDPDLEIVSADDEDDLDPLLVREEVRRAIQRHFVGDDESYEKVKSVFTKNAPGEYAPSTNALRAYLQAVLFNISSLDKRCNGLINAILSSEWVGRDESYIALYTKFLGNFAASQGGYLGRVLDALVGLLGPQKTRRLQNCKIVRQIRLHKRVINVIKYLIQLIPIASSILARVISKKLSYDFAKPEERITYTRNVLALTKHVTELDADVLSVITSELVKLDVSVQVDLEDEDDDLTEDLLHDASSSQTLVAEASNLSLKPKKLDTLSDEEDDDDDDEDDEGSITEESDIEDEELDPEAQRRKKILDAVRQVDAIMDMLFDHYTIPTMSSFEARDHALHQLTTQFTNIILPTYRSRHSQFLIFHFAQITPVTVDEFVTSQISMLMDKNLSPVLRQSAAAYLSGFVGRGAHVSATVVKDCFTLLCDEMDDIREIAEASCRGPDLKRYNTFYAMFQALMYIFCFRWRDLAIPASEMDDDDSMDEDEVTYQFSDTIRKSVLGAVHSSLNPLRICTPGIVEQFAKVTHQLNFIYLFSKINANKNVRLYALRTTNTDSGITGPDRDLSWVGDDGMMEGYFPYDPYQLPLSKRWVEGDYVQWKGLPGEKEEPDSDADDFEQVTAGETDEDNDISDEDSA